MITVRCEDKKLQFGTETFRNHVVTMPFPKNAPPSLALIAEFCESAVRCVV